MSLVLRTIHSSQKLPCSSASVSVFWTNKRHSELFFSQNLSYSSAADFVFVKCIIKGRADRHDLLLLFRFYAFDFSPSRVRIFTVICSVSTHTNIIFFILFKLFHGQLGCFYFFNFNFFCFFEFFIC